MKIRDAFEAHPGYLILEADYSQMEVACLAALSLDPLLIQEVKDGVDLHTRNAAAWRKCREEEVSDKDRKTAKIMTFQLTYGASAKRMSNDFGLPLKETEAFIDAFEAKYTGAAQWWDKTFTEVQEGRKPYPVYMKAEPEYRYTLAYPYGKRYTFIATDSAKRYDKDRRPQIGQRYVKNYPVQGLAAEILKLAQASLWRNRDLLVWWNTVPAIQIHDALYFIVSEDIELDILIDWLRFHMTEEPIKRINELAGEEWWPIDLPLRIDVKTGKKWSEMTKYEVRK